MRCGYTPAVPSELKHTDQHTGSDGHLGGLTGASFNTVDLR
jgi:hypothetical protein